MHAQLGLTQDQAMRQRREPIGRLHEAGVRIVNGSDAGVGPAKPHGHAWQSVVDLVEAGLPVADALATATSVAAAACGLGTETGRLAPGHAADLLVVDGDLANDPPALGRVRRVVVRGTPLPACDSEYVDQFLVSSDSAGLVG